MKVTLSPLKPGYASRDVHVNGKPAGYLGLEPGDTPGLTRCPVCSKENYSMMVSSGTCYACGFDLKPLMEGATEWRPQAK